MADTKRTNEEWRILLAEQQASGQTQVEWCAARGINYHTLIDRARRLRRQDQAPPETTPVPKWVEVKPSSQSEERPEIASQLIIKIGAVRITAGAGYPVAGLALLCRELIRPC
jgi:hypothetical protein